MSHMFIEAVDISNEKEFDRDEEVKTVSRVPGAGEAPSATGCVCSESDYCFGG